MALSLPLPLLDLGVDMLQHEGILLELGGVLVELREVLLERPRPRVLLPPLPSLDSRNQGLRTWRRRFELRVERPLPRAIKR